MYEITVGSCHIIRHKDLNMHYLCQHIGQVASKYLVEDCMMALVHLPRSFALSPPDVFLFPWLKVFGKEDLQERQVPVFISPRNRRDWRPYFIVPLLETPPTWRTRSPYLYPPGTVGTEDHILLSHFLRLPQPGGPGPRIYIPQDQAGLKTIFYCPTSWDSPNLVDQVPLFIFPRNRRDWRPYFIVPLLETPPTWRARSPYLYPPGTGWPRYTPGHWVPFPSPLTTRLATVEVFYPASTRDFVLLIFW
jgi:hypothetical protein